MELVTRARFNPALQPAWFGSLMEVINHITMLSIILTGAALIREREHGTVEHLLVMPVTPLEIMLAKVWSMALVVLLAATVSLTVVIQGVLRVPIEGSISLFLAGASLHLFATTSMGIFMATLARSMPLWVQQAMALAPTTHFTELSQAILYRGAGLGVVWPSFVALLLIGATLFALSLARIREAIAQMV